MNIPFSVCPEPVEGSSVSLPTALKKDSPSTSSGRTGFVWALVFLFTAGLLTTPAAADTLIDNVKGTTATPFGQVVHFSALLIGDDGKVLRTYAEGEKIDAQPKYRVDGKGRVMLPGGINANEDATSLIKMGLVSLAKKNALTGPLPKVGPRDRDAALAEIQEGLLAKGITTVADMGTSIEDWLTFRRAGDEGRLRIRIVSYADGIAPMIAIGGGKPTPWLYNDHLRMSGVLINGRLPASKSPLVLKNDEARLRNEMSRAAMDGFQVAIATEGQSRMSYEHVSAAVAEIQPTYHSGAKQWRILEQEKNIQYFMQPSEEKLIMMEAERLSAEDRVGALTPGMQADFQLSRFISFGKAGEADIYAFETWVGGVKVYERPAAPSPSQTRLP